MYSDIYQVVMASALTLVLTVSMPICQNVTMCRGGRGATGNCQSNQYFNTSLRIEDHFKFKACIWLYMFF